MSSKSEFVCAAVDHSTIIVYIEIKPLWTKDLNSDALFSLGQE